MNITTNPVISVRNLSKRYYRGEERPLNARGMFEMFQLPFKILRGDILDGVSAGRKPFWALKDVSFDLYRGERIGIIGRNGAGKSTLLKILSRLVSPTEGEARIRGRVTSLLGVGIGFNPKLTGRQNIFLDGSIHGLTNAEISKKLDPIIDFSEIRDFIDTPVKYYSSGMYARLAFSVAAHLDPDILIMDEVLSVGDVAFQKKSLQKVEGLIAGGRTLLYVSHNLSSIMEFCDKAIWLEAGQIAHAGDVKSVVSAYAQRMTKLQSSYRFRPSDIQKKEFINENEKPHPEAPGTELISIEIHDVHSKVKEVFSRDESITITARFKVLRENILLFPVIHLFKNGVHVFTSHPKEGIRAQAGKICQANTYVPALFLNSGEFSLSLAIVTPRRPKWRHVYIEDVIKFMIIEEVDGSKVFGGEYRGVVRPSLAWHCSEIKDEMPNSELCPIRS